MEQEQGGEAASPPTASLLSPGPSWGFDQSQESNAPPNDSARTSLFSDANPTILSPAPSASTANLSDSTRTVAGQTPLTGSPRPLAPLATSTAMTRRTARFEDDVVVTSPVSTQIPRAQKDADDPTTPLDSRRSLDARDFTPVTTLSRLFAGQVSPETSRNPSYIQTPGPSYVRARAASLPDHLYARGLLEGRHSDITVIAFGQRYALHRLMLDRAPFFATALTGPWLESRSKEVTLHPEEIDSTITQTAFELTLKRIYGCENTEEEDGEALGLFATGCWLEMQDLVDLSIDAILRLMCPENLASLIRLVTSNYYGRAGDRILASAKSMLCRNGWEMPLKYWDGIPGDIIREIVAGDGFFVDSEWDRWVLSKRLLDRRLKQQAIEAGLIKRGKKPIPKAPDALCLMAVRFDAVYRANSMTVGRPMPDSHQAWLALYTHPDIERLLVLLDEGIHYIHLDFEQLQFIRKAKDVLGLPVMPDKVISNALWQQMELRQKVLNADELELELGLGRPTEDPATQQSSLSTSEKQSSKGKQKEMVTTPDEEEEEMGSGSWDGNGKPRKFWIPSSDCNIVLGNGAEPVVTTSSSFQRHASRLSATLQPEDAQWATDFASSPSTLANPNTRSDTPGRPTSASGSNAGQPRPFAYTNFPPFRFSAEFPNPRLLKEKKRVYSRTVFYAGSLWNIYIQKVRSAKNAQLGVYLHRAKERETEEAIANGGIAQHSVGTVDERIGLLEREMLLRSERRDRRRTQRNNARTDPSDQIDDETSGSGGDPDATLVSTGSRNPFFSGPNALRRNRRQNMGSDAQYPGSPSDGDNNITTPDSILHGDDSDTEEDPDVFYPNPSLSLPAPRKTRAPTSTLPPYVDARPQIKTYFKIYSPSKGGRMLSVYESAPDRFNFSQSWGWKSSTLMLDEVALNGGSDGEGGEAAENVNRLAGEGKLRFMVVIGNL